MAKRQASWFKDSFQALLDATHKPDFWKGAGLTAVGAAIVWPRDQQPPPQPVIQPPAFGRRLQGGDPPVTSDVFDADGEIMCGYVDPQTRRTCTLAHSHGANGVAHAYD